MVRKRQQYSAMFKSKVALEAIRESGTLAQLSAKYHINANLISKWKSQALQGLSFVFSSKSELSAVSDDHRIKDLHAKIGELTIERDFLEQASSRLGLGGVKKW